MAVIDDIKEILVQQLAVKPELIKSESKLIDDLGADSLDAMEIVTALEEQFGIAIPDEEATEIKTVGEIINLVNQKIREKTVDKT